MSEDLSSKNTTLIIVVACAAFVGLVVIVILCRVVSRSFGRSRNPFPPPQPLAHHRQQMIQQMIETSPYALSSSNLVLGSVTSLHGSKSSLHGTAPSRSHAPDSDSDAPRPKRRRNTPTSTPLGSTEALVTVTGPQTLPPTPSSIGSSAATSTAGSGSSVTLPLLQPRLRTRSLSPYPRPASSVSTASTPTGPRQSLRIRGMPHSPYSGIEIILPAPLAPSLYAERADLGTGDRPFPGGDSRRLSVVDQWAPHARRTISERPPEQPSSMRQTFIPATSRAPPERRSSIASSSSGSSSGHTRSLSAPSITQPNSVPPVPRIPSVYHTGPPLVIHAPAEESVSLEASKPQPTPQARPRRSPISSELWLALSTPIQVQTANHS